MADNKSNKNSPLKPDGSNKSDDNFDWSKVIKLVFGWGAVIVAAVIVMQIFRTNSVSYTEIPYLQYEKLLTEDKILKATITKSDINDYSFKAELRSKQKISINNKEVEVREISVYLPEPIIKDQEAIWKLKGIDYSFDKESNEWLNIVLGFIPWIIIIAVWLLIMRRMQGSTGGTRGIFSFGKSKAKLITQSGLRVTFKDVAGADEAKMELQEIIEFLKEPTKFQKLGGKIPRGVLLLGPPGTGKTLLARAVAGEAGVPFFSISGADFVEMFVGVGASRVRDLFDQGKKNAPCIIFIDEIDAVGRHRGAGLGGGHDEREQTLNQLLVEMDGFEQNSGVIIIAATNRPDVLDPALLRPGRFDRQVVVDRPDVKGREGILKVHTRNIPLDPAVKLEILAKGTPGLSGADLANLVNEAALLAARKNKKNVEMIDFEEAKDKVMMGMERKSLIISEEEKKITSYHEIGHVLVARMLPEADPVHKVTIIPRGRALGVTSYLPIDEKHTYSKVYLESIITYALGGRAAEKLVFKHYTTGAGNDIEKATGIARKMVCEWGMSEKLGPVSYGAKEEEIFLGREIQKHRDYSERTAIEIDDEIRSIVSAAMDRSEKILKDNMALLHKLSMELLEREILDGEEIDAIVRGEELPPIKKNGGAENGTEIEVPDHVKKLIEQRKPKESISTDDAG
ncbi:MAG: cell division protein FtsH [Ignavibacteria bacterium RIFOXYB2_FULL_35_12]|nr:MAG: cell division protein FtsH [Ignavibacteria bacterium GWA2_36_19]OGU60026.1 MAG: cell division protein FtsH [Ignavibacteria bacterium GWF2_35_20]OGU78486.1 MAG: cell division protein FtsH [Ignavibacteria bacterium RBG_16_35_7]OGU87378.1 MAG: cell division protein FtsH [Ignavibacteria bacterium RIFOXYC12_FULL_35_11]OGU91715.1 MAG: cell division protein FtsH [Ignavibacteria bacterium RIFOXYA12_FULL_35_25]OGU95369.1 MAG: cell division protein FtsH [Ignavibacteria bacterium RIFOXYB12_FULL_3